MTARQHPGSMSTSRLIGASPEAIYRACTDPAMLARWRAPEGMTCKVHRFDLRPNGEYEMSLYYTSPDDAGRGKTASQEDRFVARFVELSPPHRIVEAITFDATDPALAEPMRMAVSLTEAPGGTLVTITFIDLPTGIRPEDNELGTRMALDKLARLVERTVN